MDPRPLSVLVSGSSGFIGSHVVRNLAAAGHKVIGYDLVPPEDAFPDGCFYLVGDIRTDRLPHQNIEAVVHLAALAGVRPRSTVRSTTLRPTSRAPCGSWSIAASTGSVATSSPRRRASMARKRPSQTAEYSNDWNQSRPNPVRSIWATVVS